MTVITSQANGNWNAGATWIGGVSPGIGDSAVINHTVTVSVAQTVGASAGAGSTCLTINSAKQLIVNAALTLRGGFLIKGSGSIVCAAGTGIEFDPSHEGTPATAFYYGQIGDAHNSTPTLTMNGSSGSHCYIRTNATGAHAQLNDNNSTGPFLQAGQIAATYCDFLRMGDATNPGSIFSLGAAGTYTVQNCTFTSCGRLDESFGIGNGATFKLLDTIFTTSLDSTNLNLNLATSNVNATGTRQIYRNSFDLSVNFFPAQDFDIQGNYFNLCFLTTQGDWTKFGTGLAAGANFVRMTSSFQSPSIAGLTDGNYFFFNDSAQSNPHFLQMLSFGNNQTSQNNIFDMDCNNVGTQEGDCHLIQTPSVDCVATIKNNLIVPGPSNLTVGTIFTALGNIHTSIICDHNTYFTGDQGAAVGETYIGRAGMLQSFKNNIAFSANGGEGFKLYDSGVDDNVPDLVTAANATNNCGHGLLTGTNGKGYSHLEFSSGSPGAGDIDVDPQFVSPTRKLTTWDSVVKGGPGTVIHALGLIQAAPATNIPSLYTWVGQGYYVQNASIHNAGTDGVTIGAFPFSASVSMSVSPSSLQANSVGNVVTVTGVSTSWTPGTPGSPSFSCSGVTGAQVVSQVVNSATSATLTVTASTGGSSGNLIFTDGTISAPAITVISSIPVPGKAQYWANMDEWAGYLDTWFIGNNPSPFNDSGLAQTYYDGENCAYRLKAHFGTSAYDDFIQQGFDAYTTYYVLPNTGSVQGFRNFTDGPTQDVIQNTSRKTNALIAINDILLNGAFVATGDVSGPLLSRECSYALVAHINAQLAGIVLSGPQVARMTQLYMWALGHCAAWSVSFTAPYFRPFMGGLTSKALIHYYNNISADPAIILALKALADYAWSSCWKGTAGVWGVANAFTYSDRVVPPPDGAPEDQQTQPDLNMLICPLWGWLYKQNQGAQYRVNGDLIFQGGISVYSGPFYVSGSYLGTRSASNPAGKQYDQQLFWGPDYITYAETTGTASMSVSPTTLTSNTSGNVVTATGINTTWTPGTPGSPTFLISGVSGAAITAQSISSPTSATLTVTSSAPGGSGLIQITDGTVVANIVVVTAPPPPGGANARRRPSR